MASNAGTEPGAGPIAAYASSVIILSRVKERPLVGDTIRASRVFAQATQLNNLV